MTMTMKTILLTIKTVCSFYNMKLCTKKDIMLDSMSGDQTWKRRIRLRRQATYEKKIDKLHRCK